MFLVDFRKISKIAYYNLDTQPSWLYHFYVPIAIIVAYQKHGQWNRFFSATVSQKINGFTHHFRTRSDDAGRGEFGVREKFGARSKFGGLGESMG